MKRAFDDSSSFSANKRGPFNGRPDQLLQSPEDTPDDLRHVLNNRRQSTLVPRLEGHSRNFDQQCEERFNPEDLPYNAVVPSSPNLRPPPIGRNDIATSSKPNYCDRNYNPLGYDNDVQRIQSGVAQSNFHMIDKKSIKQLGTSCSFSSKSQNLSATSVANDNYSNCNNCPTNPYLIMQGKTNDVYQSLNKKSPKFILEMNKFLNLHKSRKSCSIFCSNCSSGAMGHWYNASEHLNGKGHKRKIANKHFMKIVLCSKCFCIWCSCSEEEDPCLRDLPQNPSEIFCKMFSIKLTSPGKVSATPTNKPAEGQKKLPKNANTQDVQPDLNFIFSGIRSRHSFVEVFNEVVAFASIRSLNLLSLTYVVKPTDAIALASFSKVRVNLPNGLIPFAVYGCLSIGGVDVQTECVPSFNGYLENEFNVRNKGAIFKWRKGDMTPSCEIFKDWPTLVGFIENKMNEMERCSRMFDQLTASLRNDIRRAMSGSCTLKDICFFGSRVTGLALEKSDFDLQISTGGPCTVRKLYHSCFKTCPWFRVEQVIPWAKVPVIKVWHEKTQTVCDISLNNLNGVINSQLLRFYLNMDDRVRWLVVTVKTWASLNLMTGSFSFTSYTLAWLVLFFLMQRRTFLVPPVHLLSSLPCPDVSNLLISEENHSSFSLDMTEVYRVYDPRMCGFSRFQLLREFFSFCIDHFPNKGVAFDTYSGAVIQRGLLLQSKQKLKSLGNLNTEKNVRSYSLILIDPIKHCYNISAAVNGKLLEEFIKLAKMTLGLLDECLER